MPSWLVFFELRQPTETNGLCSFLLLCSICQQKVSISSWGWNGTEIGCSGGGVEMEACIISEDDRELKRQVG